VVRGEKQILRDVNFKINFGEKVAVIGESGSGKSTIGHLLKGISKNYDGQLLLAGNNVKDIHPKSLVERVSWISQHPFLEAGSLKNNLTFGKEISDHKAISALKKVKLQNFSNNLEKVIGENGNNLSGGQRQRISLARSFMKDTPIVILDEITSGLDRETSKNILTSILDVFKDKTIIYITHNKEELKYFNKILKVEHGTTTLIK